MFSPNFDDRAIRVAAGNWLREQTDRFGPELEWERLRAGFRFRGMRIPLMNQRGIWKPRQLAMPLSITTSPKNPYADDFDRETGLLRYRYCGTDPEHRDNAGLRRLMETEQPAAYFHGIRPGLYLTIWPAYIVGNLANELAFEVAVDDPRYAEHLSEVPPDGASAAADRSLARGYPTRRAVVRIHQRVFRHRVLHAYRNRCAFCRLQQEPLLDAARIVPVRDPTGDLIVPNALALCKIHHAAFDRFFMGVTPKGVIQVRPDLLEEQDGPMLRHGLQGLHGQSIGRPRRAADHPDPDRLDLRYQEFRQAS